MGPGGSSIRVKRPVGGGGEGGRKTGGKTLAKAWEKGDNKFWRRFGEDLAKI
jgi:hypothetical protein